MKMRWTLAPAILLPACLCGFALRAQANDGLDSKDPAALLKQLEDPSYGLRDRAHRALKALGPKAVPAMREALKRPDLRREARERISDTLAFGDTPSYGVVWRGRHGKRPPDGILDGDIVTHIDGRLLTLWHEFWFGIGPMHRRRKLTVWRTGKGSFEVTSSFGGSTVSGFAAWPDWTSPI